MRLRLPSSPFRGMGTVGLTSPSLLIARRGKGRPHPHLRAAATAKMHGGEAFDTSRSALFQFRCHWPEASGRDGHAVPSARCRVWWAREPDRPRWGMSVSTRMHEGRRPHPWNAIAQSCGATGLCEVLKTMPSKPDTRPEVGVFRQPGQCEKMVARFRGTAAPAPWMPALTKVTES